MLTPSPPLQAASTRATVANGARADRRGAAAPHPWWRASFIPWSPKLAGERRHRQSAMHAANFTPANPGVKSSHLGRAAPRAPLTWSQSLPPGAACSGGLRSEEHTSELQSRENLVCRLLLEKKNNISAER